MELTIKSIEIIGVIKDKLNSNHDVVVELSNSKRYIATFFTLINIQYLMSYYRQHSGECNNGSFFWASDMCIIEALEEKMISDSVTAMIADNCFMKIFKEIE